MTPVPDSLLRPLACWLCAAGLIVVAALNLRYVHPVPAMAYLLLALIYLPPMDAVVFRHARSAVRRAVRILLGIAIVMFTLGVSDLGDTLDDCALEHCTSGARTLERISRNGSTD